ncbi:MAG: sigma-70 family RNA polymerase sigma factor [Oscillospiraceae bacterium]|nr:sigma-70 family RNA polymerase sigma factor [Oscillospiraceae bacterium]
MDDALILELYNSRSQSAIDETAKKYGAYCLTIAWNVLKNRQDSEECVNDTYLRAWEIIPPERPLNFRAFIGKIARNLSLKKYETQNAKKRGGGFTAICEELNQCLPSPHDVEAEYDTREIGRLLDSFLRGVDNESQVIFVNRYWYGESIGAIAKRFEMSESKVKSNLFRTRNKLKSYLESEGIIP